MHCKKIMIRKLIMRGSENEKEEQFKARVIVKVREKLKSLLR